MTVSRRKFLQGLGGLGGLLLFGGSKAVFSAASNDFEMLVLGDSLMAGQGLLEKDRFYSLTANWLKDTLRDSTRAFSVTNYSHSGAKIFLQPNEIEALRIAKKDPHYFYHQEVNFSFPSIKTQVDVAAIAYVAEGKQPADIDLILVSGGITDIGASNVLNGFKKNRPLRRKIEKYCNDGMYEFLNYAAKVFPNAIIAVVGYYPMISNKSSSGEIYNSILEVYDFPGFSKPVLNNIVTKQFFKILHARMTKRARIWLEGSNAAFTKAVERFNKDDARKKALFVETPIPENRSFGTKDSLLWRMGKKGRPADDMIDVRLAECPKAIEQVKEIDLKFRVRTCEVAGIGHPNPEGAQMYFEAIKKALTDSSLMIRQAQDSK
jgi:hypothetical protein